MGEEQVAPPGRDLPAIADDREARVPDRDAGEIGKRVRLGFDRGQRRARFHDRVTERAGEPVAVPGRARARVRRPSGREHHGPGLPGARVGPDLIPVVDPFERAHPGPAHDPDAVRAAGGAQGSEHVVGSVRGGKDLAVGARLERNPAFREPRRKGRVGEGTERVAKESAVGAVPVEKRGDVALVRQVRLARAREQKLASRIGHPFEHDDSGIGRQPGRAEEAGGSAADHDHVGPLTRHRRPGRSPGSRRGRTSRACRRSLCRRSRGLRSSRSGPLSARFRGSPRASRPS